MEHTLHLLSPILSINHPVFTDRKLRLLVKREDLIDPFISGNKWRKLKFNLLEARQSGKDTLLTFGGAYSNHLYATAAAGKRFNFQTIGLVRGEATEPLNPTLAFAESCGMDIRYLSRSDYRDQQKALAQQDLNSEEIYVIPEGGSNTLALSGCAEIAEEIRQQLNPLPDYICLCCGTAGTIAGLIAGLEGASQVIGFPVLKGNFHQELIQQWLKVYQQEIKNNNFKVPENWNLQEAYHFGGYARFDTNLIDFINHYQHQFGLALDPIYTGKLFYGLEDLAVQNFFPEGSTILAIHTGGLQGVAGFNQRFGNLLNT